jgi:hypothetical protein
MTTWPFSIDPPASSAGCESFGKVTLSPPDTRSYRFTDCKFLNTCFVGLEACWFTNCEFQDCALVRTVSSVVFDDCRHIRSDFSNTQLADVMFAGGKMIETIFGRGTVFSEVTLSGVTGLHTSQRLHEVRVQSGRGLLYQLQLDAQIQDAAVGWLNRLSSWTQLRGFGKLPFFSFSYTALGGLVTGMFLLSAFNEQIERMKDSAETPGGTFAVLASRLHPIQIPSLSLLSLVSLVLLAVASTVYAASCPRTIRDFSYDQWVHQFQHPAIQYFPLGWQSPVCRAICMICYYLGAAGAVVVLVTKSVTVGSYIFAHSPVSWWRM